MPFVKKYKSRKPRVRKARKTRVPRSLGMRSRDIASCSDTLALSSIMPNTPYSLVNIALTNSIRAKTIAQGYQFYRIARVDVQWKPQFDTFTAGGTSSAPNLYYMVDKANTFPFNATVDTLKQAGAKPVRLDERIITRSFKPAVHVGSDDNNGGAAPVLETAALIKVSPWITTNANAGQGTTLWAPNSVDFFGSAEFMAIARVTARNRFKTFKHRDKCLFVNTVHDSIVLDVDMVAGSKELFDLCCWLEDIFIDIPKNFERVFGVKVNVPLAGECKYGVNWKDMVKFNRSEYELHI